MRRADADAVRAATGFAIGGVAPVGLARPVPVAIDAGLERFATVYAAAGHPHCVFATTVTERIAKLDGITNTTTMIAFRSYSSDQLDASYEGFGD